MKTSLIMEGGAMRGMFTCGVLDVFLENGIRFDGAAGISAGAVLGVILNPNRPAVQYATTKSTARIRVTAVYNL